MYLPEHGTLVDFVVHFLTFTTARTAVSTTAQCHDPAARRLAAILSGILEAHHSRNVLAIWKFFSHDFFTEHLAQ
jgi:hypothetical protein